MDETELQEPTPIKNREGRPSKYSKKLVVEFCKRIAQGNSLRTVCLAEDMPSANSIFYWFSIHPEFLQQYQRATEARAEAMAEDILDISDDGSNDYMIITKGKHSYNVEDKEVTNRSKLRVETRKWLMSKMKPKKYGERLDMTTNGKDLPTPIYNGVALKKDGPNTGN